MRRLSHIYFSLTPYTWYWKLLVVNTSNHTGTVSQIMSLIPVHALYCRKIHVYLFPTALYTTVVPVHAGA